MSIDKHLDLWKQRFNDSCLFSTQVSSSSRLRKDDSKGDKTLHRISSKFKDEPVAYLRKIRQKSKEAYRQHLAAVRNNIRLRNSAQKAQKDASLCRHKFIKLYHNKKFILSQNASMSDHKIEAQRDFRLSVQRFRRQKWEDQITINLRKEDNLKRIEELQYHKKSQEKKFRQSFRMNEQKLRRQAFLSHEKIKQERLQFSIRKKNLQQLATTKSKFNYMSKINEEMLKIKQYQDRLNEIDYEDNPQSEQSSFQTLPHIFATTFINRYN